MSFNLIGSALPVNVDPPLTTDGLLFGEPTHQVVGVDFRPTDVVATAAQLQFTEFRASAQNSINVVASANFLNIQSQPATVIGTPINVPTDVTTSSPSLTLTGINAAPQDDPPVILTTPTPSFTAGVTATYDMKQNVSDDGLSTVTYTLTNTLPVWYSFDTATGILTYNGGGVITELATSSVLSSRSGTCYAGIQFNADGNEYSTPVTGEAVFTNLRGQYLTFGSPSEVWVERIVNTGSLNWADPGSGRYRLDISRSFGLFQTTTGTNTANVTLNFYDAASGGVLINSVTLQITAILEP